MRKIKRLSLILVLCILASALFGCTDGNDQSEASDATEAKSSEATSESQNDESNVKEETTNEAIKVTFWNDKLANNAELAKKLKDVWSASSELELDVNSFGDTASYQTAMSQSIDNAEASPNAFTWWSGEQLETLATSGKLLELDDVWDTIIEMGVSPDIKEALSYNGHAYAVPYSLLNNVCIYNKDAFIKAGITEEPKTFDEFLVDCQKLVDAGITPIGIKNDSWASFIWFQALVASYDPELYVGVCNGSIKYTDEKMVEVFEIWQEMLDKGYFADPIASGDNAKRVALGECAIFIEPQGYITGLEKDYGLAPGENIDAFALPSMNGGKAVVFFEVSPMAVPAVVANPEASKNLLQGYYTKETQTVTLNEEGIVLTSTVNVENPTLAKISAMAADTSNYQSILRYYENTPPLLRDFALNELAKFMDGQQDAATTLANIQAEADKVFAE